MKIIFYNNKEENIVVKKENITPLFEIDGTLREGCSIYNPVIQIKTYGKDFTNNGAVQSIELANLIKANYAYVEDFSRYYYIDDIIGEYSNVATLFLKCDVLMSFKDYFKELNVFANRNEYNYNLSIVDNLIPSKCYDIENTRHYETSFNLNDTPMGYSYVVVLAGKYSRDLIVPQTNFSTEMNKVLIFNYYTIKKFLDALLSTSLNTNNLFGSELGQAIQHIFILPFDIRNKYPTHDFNTGTASKPKYVIDFCGNSITLEYEAPSYIYELGYGTFSSIYTTSIDIEPLNIDNFPDFMYYNPYSRCRLIIPFYGILDIQPELVKYKLTVTYNVNIIDGSCSIVIISEKYGRVYLLNDCILFAELPLNYANSTERSRNILFGSLQILTGIAGAVVTGGASLGLVANGTKQMISPSKTTSKYNYSKDKKRLTSITQTSTPAEYEQEKYFKPDKLLNYISDSTIDLMSSNIVKNFRGGGYCGGTDWTSYKRFTNGSFVLSIIFTYLDYYVPNGYAHLVGRPTDYSGKLKGLFGYTEIAGVHIEGDMGSSSQSEKEEIEQALKTGVILPNPQSTTPSENETW